MKHLVLAAVATMAAVLVFSAGYPSPAVAGSTDCSVTVGGIFIRDKRPANPNTKDGHDTNDKAGTIEFDSADPASQGGLGQASVTSIAGKLVATFNETESKITLTDFRAFRGGDGKDGAVKVKFECTFDTPPSPVVAFDSIDGKLKTGFPGILKGDRISWQGFVNGNAITPTNGDAITGDPEGGCGKETTEKVDTPLVVKCSHGDQRDIVGGPNWTLRGELSITLGQKTTSFNMADSAEVGIFSCPLLSLSCPVGGTTELLVGGSDAPSENAGSSGGSTLPIAAAAGGLLVALAGGGLFVRRRLVR